MKTLFIIFSVIASSLTSYAQSVKEGRYVSLQSGYGLLSSNLSGSGFNSVLPSHGGPIYGIDFSYQDSDQETQYLLKYDKTSFDQAAPEGVSPTNLTVFREELRLMLSLSHWDYGPLENLRLGIGYGILKTGATDTTPNNVLTNLSSQGLLLNTSYKLNLFSDSVMLTEFLIYLPHQVNESQQVTGYNPKFIGAEIKLLFEHPLSNEITGFIGTSYRLDQVTYDGSVSRGVTSGQDTRTHFTIPVGIKIGY